MGVQEELLALEHARCEAISTGDVESLEQMLDDGLTHTHVTGRTDTKDSYLRGLRSRPRETTRGDDLRVRLYGDVAVMTGSLRNAFPPPEAGGEPSVSVIQALQVWVNQGGTWRQVAFASSGGS